MGRSRPILLSRLVRSIQLIPALAMPANSEKDHLSIVICGHVDSGKSTTTGRLIFELGGLPERELEKLKQEAERLGKSSFAFAFYMDRQKKGTDVVIGKETVHI